MAAIFKSDNIYEYRIQLIPNMKYKTQLCQYYLKKNRCPFGIMSICTWNLIITKICPFFLKNISKKLKFGKFSF